MRVRSLPYSEKKVQPIQMALRVFPKLLYGPTHAYGNPYSGSGTEESVAKLTREELIKFHSTWFKPNNATLVVVGDTTLAEIQPKLEALFSGWRSGTVPEKNIATTALPNKQVVYLIDKPGAIQSVILAGVLAPPKANPDELSIESMNTVLGGAFISRLNMNLREDKHWSTAWLVPSERRGSVIHGLCAGANDKTKESVVESRKELRAF